MLERIAQGLVTSPICMGMFAWQPEIRHGGQTTEASDVARMGVAKRSDSARRWLGVGFVAVVLSGALWWILRPNELRRTASEAVQAMRTGDGDTLFYLSHPVERKCSGLTTANAQKAWRILVGPHVAREKFLRVESAAQTSNDYQATASAWFEDRAGEPWRFVMIANRSEGHPRVTVVLHMLTIACAFTDEGRYVGTDTARMLAGVRKYKERLKEIGIERLMLNPSRCLTWEQLEEYFVESLSHRPNERSAKDPGGKSR
ncbi:MAG: hypothetical protein UZ18_ATM001002221 [Armatimonadetes bacterium OLB18]|nr:MAG: hypothetical protein UZ18_ATM001002221 [Armatimonadetes bacterium OLB18]